MEKLEKAYLKGEEIQMQCDVINKINEIITYINYDECCEEPVGNLIEKAREGYISKKDVSEWYQENSLTLRGMKGDEAYEYMCEQLGIPLNI